MRSDIERAGLPMPRDSTVGTAIWDECENWLHRSSSMLAAGDPAALSPQSIPSTG
jgi:hypothetical protein